ncbi:MAG: galactose mutarotase [Eubacterium sp.]|nr:galactose mutarotase [Eubacterium sp.]
MSVEKKQFGTTSDGIGVTALTITNKNGLTATILDFGGIVQSLCVPDKNGKLDDIVLGYDTVADYEDNGPNFGAFVGRVANRTAGARFDLNGTEYKLEVNDNGVNNLHSGRPGFSRVMYKAENTDNSVILERVSPGGEQGFPGALEVKLTYTLTDDNEFKIEYFARSDADTIYAPTNHSYFNLAGHDGGDITGHIVQINSDSVTKTDENQIPTGEFVNVEGTPFDFREEKMIKLDIDADDEQIKIGGGYDHNFALMKEPRAYGFAGKVTEKNSGRTMEIYTDLPGLQMYTGNSIGEEKGKNGVVYKRRHGVCFETQFFPDAVNHPEFASSYLAKGEAFNSVTVYKFTTA